MLRNRIGDLLRAHRVSMGLTLREAEPLVRLSYSQLGQVETAVSNTSLDTLDRILAGYGVDLAVNLVPVGGEHTPPTQLPASRRALAERFLAILPHVAEEELDVFVHELALWERRYSPE